MKYTTIDEYIASFPKHIQKKLNEVKNTIKQEAPKAIEKISYQMPTFYLNWNLIHFAAFTNHIWLYPTPSGISAFKKELSNYKSGKGSIQLPIDKPIPTDLIKKIVKFRIKENTENPKIN